MLAAYTRLFGDRDPVGQPGTATGSPGNWWTVMALVPEILTHFQAGGAMCTNPNRVLPSFFRELAVARTGFVKGCKFIFSQHCKGARAAGISDEKIAAIPSWTSSDLFDGKERAVLAYVDELALAGGRVQDATFNRLREHFVDEAVLELTYISSLYQAYATFTRALKLECDDIDEWVAEVPAPEGSGDEVDVMAAMSGGSDR